MIVEMVKVNGMLRIIDPDRPAMDHWKKGISEGQIVQVNFAKELPPASVQMRKLFHLMRDRYAAGLGYDKEYAKDELCILCGVATTLEDALEDPPSWPGHLREMWGETHIRKSTNAYTEQEMRDLIQGTIKAGLDNGLDMDDLARDYGRMYAAGTATNRAS